MWWFVVIVECECIGCDLYDLFGYILLLIMLKLELVCKLYDCGDVCVWCEIGEVEVIVCEVLV